MLASVVCEHADAAVDSTRVLRMLLIHDVVEIDAGDAFLYDAEARRAKAEAERRAAERIYGLLPGDQGRELRELWLEFEAGQSADARFARAIDRLMPLLHNFHTEGRTWREHGITADQVLAANAHIERGSALLWKRAKALIEEAVERGYLAPPV
jgi:putative hydrolase of HD superfamily